MSELSLEVIEQKPEVKHLSENATKALAWAEKAVIKTQENHDKAAEAVVRIRDEKEKGDTLRKFFTDPLNKQVKKINGLFMPNIKALESAEQMIRLKLSGYQLDLQRKSDAARMKVEKDLALGKIKNVETAVNKLDKIVEPEKTVRGEAFTATYKDKPTVVIENEDLVPREYCSPDKAKYEKMALALHEAGKPMIDGLKVVVEKIPSFRKNG